MWVAAIAKHEKVPRSAPLLRQALAQANFPDDEDTIGLALGTQGEHGDASRLYRRPESLPLAIAVTRCGRPCEIERARAAWKAPADLRDLLRHADNLEWLAALGPADVELKIRRQIRRLEAASKISGLGSKTQLERTSSTR